MKIANFKAALFIGITIFLVSTSVYFYQMFFSRNLVNNGYTEAFIHIPPGATIFHVKDTLEKYRLVDDVLSFMFVSRVLDYQENVKPGRYRLTAGMNNLEAVRLLRSGIQVPVKVIFHNVRLKEELPEKLCKNLWTDPDDFYALLTNPQKVAEVGFDTLTIACMFIPNTYYLYWNTSAEELFARMKREYDRFWNEKRRSQADGLGLTPIQVSILASIVQAETNQNDEKPRIAGVYLNRLHKKMPLQADPTLVFAQGDFSIKRVLNSMKKIDSPYNTYKHTGLPPGPINIPEISSIDAVLNAERHRYLFFCAKEDLSGYHNFAETLEEHNRNAQKYISALNRKGIK
ncbi:MAG: endolytic transglycosylase MltG [Cytophagales bacterium]|nr:endolytic transglycosylase MltG [Cytophagales bacterium]MDW8385071.1 endolytic transglycosylase MltG [Flammeovirgaceae bacterium]